jgi:hypothetical protein
MSAVNNAADSIAPPIDVQVHAVTTGVATVNTELDVTEFFGNNQGRWITIQCETETCYYNFSTATGLVLNPATRDAVGPPSTAVTGVGIVIQPGETHHLDLRNWKAPNSTVNGLFLNHISPGGAGTLRFWVSDGNV